MNAHPTFGEMKTSERAELLRAWKAGAAIEYLSKISGFWRDAHHTPCNLDGIYRIKPEQESRPEPEPKQKYMVAEELSDAIGQYYNL